MRNLSKFELIVAIPSELPYCNRNVSTFLTEKVNYYNSERFVIIKRRDKVTSLLFSQKL